MNSMRNIQILNFKFSTIYKQMGQPRQFTMAVQISGSP